jgi:hypothetical protein
MWWEGHDTKVGENDLNREKIYMYKIEINLM